MSRDLFVQHQGRLEEEVDANERYTAETSTSFVEQMEALNLSSISAHTFVSQEQEGSQKISQTQTRQSTIIRDSASPGRLELQKNTLKSPEHTPEPITATTDNATPTETIKSDVIPSYNQEIPPFQMGDHVYRRCTYALIPFQHHAIVLDVWNVDPEEEGDECAWILKVFDFSRDPKDVQAITPDSPRVILSSPEKKRKDGLRVYESPAQHWQKVIYGAPLQRHIFSSSGTCTAATSDAPGLIRARVQFLLEHVTDGIKANTGDDGSQTALLPEYAWLYANSECVAVWCKTGTWATMQAASWLTWSALGQVKSAATIAGVAAATQVAVPAAGLWGWLGYTTQASLLTVQPALAPAIATYGMVTVAVPAMCWYRSRSQWQSITIRLNEAFWNAAVDDPELFVDAITHWSE